MNETLEFLVRHGAAVLFAAVFVEQMGVPLPAAPWLLTAGALAATGRISWFVALSAATVGSLLADLIWFYLGRYGGQRMLNLLCRISLEPDSCVRRTQDLFTRYGMRGVVAAKFIPGLSTLVPPLAGNSGVSAPRFFFFDGLGSLLYAGCFIVLGVLFSHQLEQVIVALASLGRSALGLVVGLVALYIGFAISPPFHPIARGCFITVSICTGCRSRPVVVPARTGRLENFGGSDLEAHF